MPFLRVLLVRHGESENNIYSEISRRAFEENRVADPDITERGIKQAQSVANYFQSGENAILHSTIDTIYVSPMKRTMQTALPLVTAMMNNNNNNNGNNNNTTTAPNVQVWTDIYEITGVHDKGIGQPGMSRTEMQTEFPLYSLPTSVTEGGWYDTSLGRESQQHGAKRCQQVWNQLCNMADNLKQKNSSIVLVVHGDFIDHLLQAAFGMLQLADSNNNTNESSSLPEQKKKTWVFPTWNGSITALDIPSLRNNGQGTSTTNTSCHRRRPTMLFHNAVSHLSPELVKTDKLGKC